MWLRCAMSLLAGVILVGAFEPFSQPWLAFICLGALLYLWRDSTPKEAFKFGLSFGLGFFLVGVSWVYVSLNTYGGMPLWMGAIAVLGFAALLSLFVALPGYIVARLFPCQQASSITTRLLAIPPIWGLFEWMKSWVLTGFPWLDLGYTQTSSLLGALAPVGGVYLVSLAVVSTVSLGLLMLNKPTRILAVAVLFALFVSVVFLEKVHWSQTYGEAIKVAVVQGNVPVEKKWLPDHRVKTVEKYAELTQLLYQNEPDIQLTVWPETALPVFLQQVDAEFWQTLLPKDMTLLTGLLDSQGIEEEYNAALLLCNGQQQVYRKRHLVPFGEYLPMRFLFDWVLDYLQLPMSDFSAWQGKQPLSCGTNIDISLSICYEDAFAAEMREHLGTAKILVNISEDAWFGNSLAPHQRLQMAQMRARELARPLVRSANTGPSVFINERGEVLAMTPQFKAYAMAQEIQPMTGFTPFARWGNWLFIVVTLVWLAILVTIARLKR